MDRWYIIDSLLVKNPTKEKIECVEKHKIIELRKGDYEDVVIETWWVSPIGSNQVINFAYQPSLLSMSYMSLTEMRNAHFKKHGVLDKVHFDKCYTLPPSYFTGTSVKLPAGLGR